MDVPVAAIVAMDRRRLIGAGGQLPWHLPEDLAHFRRLTAGAVVLMGRKTWDSLPPKFKPLPGRINVVVSRNPGALGLPAGVLSADSPEAGLRVAKAAVKGLEQVMVWVIGGAEMYRALLPLCDQVQLTVVNGEYVGDAWLPSFEQDFDLVEQRDGEQCVFQSYVRRR